LTHIQTILSFGAKHVLVSTYKWLTTPQVTSMAHYGGYGHSPSMCKTQEALEVEVIMKHYGDSISPKTKVEIQDLEEDVKVVMKYQEDEDVDKKIGEIIPNVGCSSN
jgi:hypothetical protein